MWQRETRSREKAALASPRSDLLVINKIDLAPYVGAESRRYGTGIPEKCAVKDPFSLQISRGLDGADAVDRMDQKKCTSGRMLKSDSRE